MAIDWDSVLPNDDVNLDHVNADTGNVILIDKADVADAVPDAWRGGNASGVNAVPVVQKAQPEVIYVRPVAPVAAQPVNVQAWGGNGNVQVKQVTQPGQKVNLMQASKQWAIRPADERFWTIQEMAAQCKAWKDASSEQRVDLANTVIVNDSGRMLITGGGMKGPGEFTHYSFGQLCQTAGAPAGYLRELNGDLAAQCLTSGLKKKTRDVLGSSGNVLIRNEGGGSQRVGAFLSGGYSRIWNADVIGRLGQLQHDGWRVPPARPATIDDPRARPATEADLLDSGKGGGGGLQVRVGDLIAPAGLYASDRDCFAFMVKETCIEVGGAVINRGFFASNSEVGNQAFNLCTFGYDSVCGNHICWGASEVSEVRIVHRGRANSRWIGDLHRALVVYSGKSADVERKLILGAMSTEIAHDKDSVVEKLFKDKRINVTKTNLMLAYDWAVKEARLRGNIFKPNSVWGMVCGLTRVSQECGWADERVAMDQAAGKLLTM